MRILCCPAVSLCPIRARGRRACPVEPRIGPSGPRRNDLDEAEHWRIRQPPHPQQIRQIRGVLLVFSEQCEPSCKVGM